MIWLHTLSIWINKKLNKSLTVANVGQMARATKTKVLGWTPKLYFKNVFIF